VIINSSYIFAAVISNSAV